MNAENFVRQVVNAVNLHKSGGECGEYDERAKPLSSGSGGIT